MHRLVAIAIVLSATTTAVRADDAPVSLRFPPRVAVVAETADVVDKPCEGCRPTVTTGRRVLATIVAATPLGMIGRGIGSWMVNDSRTAKKLLGVAGIGVGLIVAGGVPAGVSGGNPYLIVPFVPMLVAGTGLFMQSWFADIYNAAGVHAPGSPRARVPWAVGAGLVWTHDAYRERAIGRFAGRVAAGRLELDGTYYQSTDDAYRAGDLTVGVRVLGAPSTGAEISDGSYLLVRAIARGRDDEDDRLQVATIEADVVGRLDLRHIARVLDGSFAELSTGGGLERAAYRTASEKGGLLLGRFAYGVYLGRRGEAQLYYDHRRDSFAGGIAAWRAAGFVGSVGAAIDARVTGRWAAHAELEIGSAWVTTVGVRYQGGPE